MKLLPLLGPALCASTLLLSASCQSQAKHQHDHWSAYSIAPSMSRAFLTYDPETDGDYRDFQWRKKKNIELTLRRHFFNHNPDNPFEAVDESIYEPRPVHSIVPAPHRYIHLEGLVFGGIFYAAGGYFIPLPPDSVIGTFEEGGSDEFFQGVDEFTRPIGVMTDSFLHDALGFPDNKGEGGAH